MPDPIRIISLEQTCRAWPAQWEGETIDGREVYIRFRHGHLSLGVGADLNGAIDNTILSLDHGHEYSGEMEEDEMLQLVASVAVYAPRAEDLA